MNRTARRILKARAPAMARLWAATCLDFSGGNLQPIDAPAAVEALRKAFQRMIEAGATGLGTSASARNLLSLGSGQSSTSAVTTKQIPACATRRGAITARATRITCA